MYMIYCIILSFVPQHFTIQQRHYTFTTVQAIKLERNSCPNVSLLS